jgi:hypothetical protein
MIYGFCRIINFVIRVIRIFKIRCYLFLVNSFSVFISVEELFKS